MILLHLLLSRTIWKSEPAEVRFECPVCAARDVIGEAQDQVVQNKLLRVIPIGTVRSTWVKCRSCGAESRADLPVAELRRQAPGEINRHIRRSLPPILITFLVASLLTMFLPAVGLVFAVIALAQGWKFGGWVRTLLVAAVTLAVVLNVMMAIGAL